MIHGSKATFAFVFFLFFDVRLTCPSLLPVMPRRTTEQATQWLAVFKDSQEAWSLDDILLSQVFRASALPRELNFFVVSSCILYSL